MVIHLVGWFEFQNYFGKTKFEIMKKFLKEFTTLLEFGSSSVSDTNVEIDRSRLLSDGIVVSH